METEAERHKVELWKVRLSANKVER